MSATVITQTVITETAPCMDKCTRMPHPYATDHGDGMGDRFKVWCPGNAGK